MAGKMPKAGDTVKYRSGRNTGTVASVLGGFGYATVNETSPTTNTVLVDTVLLYLGVA